MFNLSFQKLSNPSSLKLLLGRINREDWIFSGTILLLFLFLLVFWWGGYMFYTTRQPPEPKRASPAMMPSLTQSDIDETVKLLDEREQKFKKILAE